MLRVIRRTLGLLVVVVPLLDASRLSAQTTGIVRGQVTEVDTKAPLPLAQVAVVGTRLASVSANDGSYIIRGVTPGTVTLRIVRLGYESQSRQVTVPGGDQVTADFVMSHTAVRLDEVITTATGEQSRRAIGNIVGTVKPDSIASIAPITSIHEVLSGRIAGVQVMNGWGMTGTTPTIRIRGANSISLTNEPLWIVDGIRVDNQSLIGNFAINPQNAASAFSPDEVESIDVIKGPSAAALYGTAAANGVIVIKTKRGQAGKARWAGYTEYGRVSQPANWTDNYRAWGRNVVNGVPTGAATQCRISNLSLGQCVIDSSTTFNPLMNSETSPYAKSTPRNMLALQVSGGADKFTYFVSGQYQKEIGPYTMPGPEIARLTTERGAPPRSREINPNQLHETGVRGNFNVNLGSTANLAISTGYTDRQLQTPFEGSFFQGITTQAITAPGFRTQYNGYAAQYLGDMMTVYQPERSDRFTGSAAATWLPLEWLNTRATIGIDQAANFNTQFEYTGEGTRGGWGSLAAKEGGKQLNRSSLTKYSVDMGATATYDITSSLNSKLSVGGQWFFDAFYQSAGSGYTLPPGVSTVNSASTRAITETTNENATFGEFVEEVLGWRDRLFGTFGARTDQNSAFGRAANKPIYPRAALSYVISDEPFFPHGDVLSHLRLRAAYGSAGVQPTTTAALQFLSATSTVISGTDTPALRLTAVGNKDLKPERTNETEFGVDANFFRDKVNIEATHFYKRSQDALISRTLPPSLGAGGSRFENIGAVENKGYELSIDVDGVRTPLISLGFHSNGSITKNKVLDLGGVPPTATLPQRTAVVGYPIAGLWSRPILSFADANKDGIITANEIVVGDTAVFAGPSLPEREAGFSPRVGLFRDKVNITAQFDYRGHFFNQWGGEHDRCVGGNCRAVNDKTAPLADQAAAVATSSPALGNTYWGYLVPNDYIRFRELAVSFDVPESVLRKARFSRGNVVLSGRNLGVPWTKFPGIDPESNGLTGLGNQSNWSPPPIRYFIARLNLTY